LGIGNWELGTRNWELDVKVGLIQQVELIKKGDNYEKNTKD